VATSRRNHGELNILARKSCQRHVAQACKWRTLFIRRCAARWLLEVLGGGLARQLGPNAACFNADAIATNVKTL
jgi:hypothetical protein